MEFLVKKPHEGDKWYPRNSTREARENDVRHLVERGVLVKMEAAPLNKAAYAPETKETASASDKKDEGKPARSEKKAKGAAK